MAGRGRARFSLIDSNLHCLTKSNNFTHLSLAAIELGFRVKRIICSYLATPIIPCVTLPVAGATFDATTLSNQFPEIKKYRSLNEQSECAFKPPYVHLNDLLKFSHQRNYSVTHAPTPCQKYWSKPLIIFGIKSMPENIDNRNSIRSTWLNNIYWNETGHMGGHQPLQNHISNTILRVT